MRCLLNAVSRINAAEFRQHMSIGLATVVALHRADILGDAIYKRRCAALSNQPVRDGEPNGMPHFERSRNLYWVSGTDPIFQSRKKRGKEQPHRCGRRSGPSQPSSVVA